MCPSRASDRRLDRRPSTPTDGSRPSVGAAGTGTVVRFRLTGSARGRMVIAGASQLESRLWPGAQRLDDRVGVREVNAKEGSLSRTFGSGRPGGVCRCRTAIRELDKPRSGRTGHRKVILAQHRAPAGLFQRTRSRTEVHPQPAEPTAARPSRARSRRQASLWEGLTRRSTTQSSDRSSMPDRLSD